jgi:hypothetical protein
LLDLKIFSTFGKFNLKNQVKDKNF